MGKVIRGGSGKVSVGFIFILDLFSSRGRYVHVELRFSTLLAGKVQDCCRGRDACSSVVRRPHLWGATEDLFRNSEDKVSESSRSGMTRDSETPIYSC